MIGARADAAAAAGAHAAVALAEARAAEARRGEPALAGPGPLVDVHAHWYHAATPRAEWAALNASRLRAGERMGVSWHVASVLGTWGAASPTYFASPDDLRLGNDVAYAVARACPDRVRAYVHVNPNFPEHALAEMGRGAGEGAVGLKLSASRRADDALLDELCAAAADRGWPVLHHIWQWRRRDWPNQEASDGVELARLAARHPRTRFLLAHIGGGGEYRHTFPAVADLPNVVLDLSGSGVDRGMLDGALEAVGPRRVAWACDVTMCTGLAKLRALDHVGLSADEIADVRWRNAVRLFPAGAFPGLAA